MKTNVIIPVHHEKNKPTIEVTQVVELGNVTALTLGGYGQQTEHVRPNQHRS